jgi:hypothetical protein
MKDHNMARFLLIVTMALALDSSAHAGDGAVAQPAAAAASPNVAQRGGLWGIGLVVTPKLGGALGSVLLPGAGPALGGSLELGYLLPLPQPLGRDLEVFVDTGYSGPSTRQSVAANDPRLPSGGFDYTLTLHQLAATWGLLYRIPLPLTWLRPTVALGARTVWSNTLVNANSAGQPYGVTSETAFDVGVDGRVGADFFVGPGAIAVELSSSWVPADRFIVRKSSTTEFGIAVGYRFFL